MVRSPQSRCDKNRSHPDPSPRASLNQPIRQVLRPLLSAVCDGQKYSKKEELSADLAKELRSVLEKFSDPETMRRYRGAVGSSGRRRPARILSTCVGIDEYDALPHLANCGSDARLFGDYLRQIPDADVQVVLSGETSKQGIEAAIVSLLRSVESRPPDDAPDVIFFSYAGHAYQARIVEPLVTADLLHLSWHELLNHATVLVKHMTL